MQDLIIVGSGPAGLSAAVYAKRAKMDVTVIEKSAYSGGQIVNSERVDNYLGLYGLSGFDLAMKFREHVDSLKVPFETAEVTGITQLDKEKKGFSVTTADGRIFETKAVLAATGADYKKLNVSGEERFLGCGVSYCATCDGAFYRDKDVAVIGGGDVALWDAVYLAKLCRQVYLVHRRDGFRAAKYVQDRVLSTENIIFLPFYEVKEIIGEQKVEQLSLMNNQGKEERVLDVAGVFVAVGMTPQTAFVKAIVDTDKAGYIKASEDGITSTPGIFAAGDVRTKALRQLATAVSDGANAVGSIEQYLSQNEL